MSRMWSAALTALVVCMPAIPELAAQVEEPPPSGRVLTLTDLLDLALEQNLDLQSARARVDAIATLTDQVRSQWLPRVVAYGVYMHLDHDTTADFASSFGDLFAYFEGLGPLLENLGLEPLPPIEVEPLVIQHQEDYRAGGSVSVEFQPRSLVQYDSAELARQQGETLLESAGVQLAWGITELYYGLVTLREMRAVALLNVETRRVSLEQVQARYNLGMTTELDVLRARLSLSEAELQVTQLDSTFEDLLNQTAMLVQVEPAFDVVRPSITPDLTDPTEVLALATEHHPELRSAQIALQLAENASEEVDWSWAPVFDASFNLNAARESAFSDENVRWDITLKLVWPLFLGGVRLAQRDQRAAEEVAADYHLRQVRARLRSDIERAFVQHRQLQSELALAQQQLELANGALHIAQALYDQGLGTQLDLMEAETRVFAVQTRAVQTEMAMARQNIYIYSLTGRIWRP